MTGQVIPIEFRDKAGQIQPQAYKGVPLVKVVFRFDPLHGSGHRTLHNYQEIDALIDTGADLNFADPALIAKTGCPAHNTATVQGGTSTIQSSMYLSHLFFPTLGRQVETDVVSAPLRSNGRHYDLVLGILFLQLGILHMDFAKGQHSFTFS